MRRLFGLACVGIIACVSGCGANPHAPDISDLAGTLFINEFMADNSSIARDEAGDYDDWVELYNAGDKDIRTRGMYLTDDLEVSMKWAMPDTAIRAGGHLLVWCDGEYKEGPLHATFKLNADPGEQLGLYTTTVDRVYLVDTLTFGAQTKDIARGRMPDGDSMWRFLAMPTPGLKNRDGTSPYSGLLYINEFMAANNSTYQDETGDYDDWIELHNSGAEPIDLGGMYLTDNLATPDKWTFPEVTIPGGGYLVVWADGQPEEGALHTGFNLAAMTGEELGLFAPDGAYTLVVDSLRFGTQRTDTSYGRRPDGTDNWRFMSDPTPGAENEGKR